MEAAAQEEELAHLGEAIQLADGSEQLMQEIRALGRVPKAVRGDAAAQASERQLALRLRRARDAGEASAAQWTPG